MLYLTLRGDTCRIDESALFEGLRQVHQSHVNGDKTASLRLPDSSAIVSNLQVSRMIKDHDLLIEQFGVASCPPVYAVPGMVTQVGDDGGFRVQRTSWDTSREISDQLQFLWRVIRMEERHTVTIDLREISMNPDGSVVWAGESPVFLEQEALRQLLKISKMFPKGVAYVQRLPPSLRSINWNESLKKLSSSKSVCLRFRRNPLTGLFSIFSVVSPTYSVLEIDWLATALASSLPVEGMRGSVFFDSSLSDLRIEGFWQTEYIFNERSKDVFRFGVQVRSNDLGEGGVWVAPVARRVLTGAQCLAPIDDAVYYTHHQGDMDRVAAGITSGMERSVADLASFEASWRDHRRTVLACPSESFLSDIHFILSLCGLHPWAMKRDVFLTALRQSTLEEPMEVEADLLNAVGRLQQLPCINQYQREALEIALYGLVMTKDWARA